ncbi:MAG: MerR family transcriptional regulator [Bacteroidales bacterium]|nr:MerR family transcriptional regulator [Bacteroidales bacterium]
MAIYTIKDIEKMSGIKAHTIRVWERRYGIVIPKRTDTNIRYYTDEDLRELLNISILNKNGMKISKIAELDKDEIAEKVEKLLDSSHEYSHIIDAMLLSMVKIDEYALSNAIDNAWEQYGFEKLIEDIVFPLLERIGLLWQTNAIYPVQERFVSNILRHKFIIAIDKEIPTKQNNNKKLIFFLPEGELHEFGLLFYSYIARKEGFEVIYLGASIPLQDLEKVQRVTQAKAFISAHVTAIDKQELENMFDYFKDTFPSVYFYITGLQIRELNPTLPNNFFVFSSAADFKEYLIELEDAVF